MKNVVALGGYTTKFGELWTKDLLSLGAEAIGSSLAEVGIEKEQVEALYVGNMLSGILSYQENLGAAVAEAAGFTHNPAVFKIEAACASGGLAMHTAINSLLSGAYKTVMVLGVEKMTDCEQDLALSALMAAGSEQERQSGATFTGLYALMAQAYLDTYNVSESELAAASVKNHYHGTLNEKAQFKKAITIADVLASTKVASPLKLLDCSPLSDGASAIILTVDENLISKSKNPVSILASTVASDTVSLSQRKSITSLQAVKVAAKKAFTQTKLTTSDIQIAEVHDCFSIAEVMALEDLGFSKIGMAAKDLTEEKFTHGKGTIVINSSGGLKACGHPVGATGIKQAVEIVSQLQGKAGLRQVKNLKKGLVHNVAGTGAVAVIHIFSN